MVVYSRFHNSRKTTFLLTTIAEKNPEGEIIFLKKAAHIDALPFLKTIYQNYVQLQKVALPFTLLPAQLIQEDVIAFPYCQGENLEQKLLTALYHQEKEKLFVYIEEYISMLKKMITGGTSLLSSQFQSIFGESKNKYALMDFGIFDLNFDNFSQTDSQVVLLDYEWIFPFQLPYKFILFRAITYFYFHYFYSISPLLPLKEMYDYIHITEEEKQDFIRFEYSFQNFVHNSSEQSQSFEIFKESYLLLEHDGGYQESYIHTKLAQIQSLTKENTDLMQNITHFNNRCHQYDHTIQSIYQSWSWKVTAPFRYILGILRKCTILITNNRWQHKNK